MNIHEQKPLVELLGNWRTGKVTEIRNIYYSGKVFLVKTADGRKYILKQKEDTGRIVAEHLLLSALARMRLPVPAPFTGKKGEYSFEKDGRHYCLYPYMTGAVTQHFYTDGAEKRANVYGKAMAGLHAGMGRCSTISGFETMDPVHEVQNNALPWIIRNSSASDISLTENIAREFSSGWMRLSDMLPVQLIHKDLHPVNFLLDKDDRLIGIIDFDSVVKGPRVFDPCYCCAYMLINGFDDPGRRNMWFELLRSLINGYEGVIRLTDSEKNAFAYGILCALFILDAAFYRVNNASLAIKAQKVIFWVYEHRNCIINTCRLYPSN